MKERPILFSSAMIRAILAGSKSQTRRAVKGWALDWLQPGMFTPEFVAHPENDACPYGTLGDRLWVREAFQADPPIDSTWHSTSWHGCPEHAQLSEIPERYRLPKHCIYRATWAGDDIARWRPSIHMPRWASRITLEVTEVRVERLGLISAEDCLAEGVRAINFGPYTPRLQFRAIWDEINSEGAWDANPWVWAVSFRRLP